MKSFGILVAVFVLLALGWLLNDYVNGTLNVEQYKSYFGTTSTMTKSEEDDIGVGDSVMCAQVITPAIDPTTKEIKEFPTPCDVPEGWEIIVNDVPSLELGVELEVQ